MANNATKLPSGNWRVRVYAGKGENGKNVYKSFTAPTADEAEYMAAAYRMFREKEAKKSVLDITVGEVIDRYIASKDAILSPTTIAGYRRIRKNLLKTLMNIPLKTLDNITIQNALNVDARRVKPKTVRNASGLVSAALRQSYPDFKIDISLPAKQKTHKTLLEPNVVFSIVKGTVFELPVLLAMWLGLRMSEIRGIRRTDIVDGVLSINEVIVDVDNTPVTKVAAKTYESKRRIVLPEYIQALINNLPAENDRIITLSGQAIHWRFANALAVNNLPHMSFHDLRHVNASVMLKLGIPNKYAMERGGWASDGVLKAVYQHTFSEERIAVDQRVDAYFSEVVRHNI